MLHDMTSEVLSIQVNAPDNYVSLLLHTTAMELDSCLYKNVAFESFLSMDYALTYSNGLLFEQFLSGGQSEVEATQNLNAMNQAPNPWHVSFSYARALQNTCLKTWGGRPENVKAAQDVLVTRAKANSTAQLGKYTGEGESAEAKEGMFVKGYVY